MGKFVAASRCLQIKLGGGSFVHFQLDDWLVAMIALTSAQARQSRKRKGMAVVFSNAQNVSKR